MACPAHSAAQLRPALEVADIVRTCGEAYRATHRLSAQQERVLQAIAQCRTAALGGHAARCDHCGMLSISYRSCGNRHCPKCQTLAKQRWLERQCADLLDIDYWHLVFTLPHVLNPLAQGNPEVIYKLLFRAASETLLAFGRNPRWLKLRKPIPGSSRLVRGMSTRISTEAPYSVRAWRMVDEGLARGLSEARCTPCIL